MTNEEFKEGIYSKQELIDFSEKENWQFVAGLELIDCRDRKYRVKTATEQDLHRYGVTVQPGYIKIEHPATGELFSLQFRPNPRTARIMKWMKKDSQEGE